MKARTVVDVMLGEAKAGDYEDMLSIASVMANRAAQTGQPIDSVVRVTSQFNAYNKTLPAGVGKYRAMAVKALKEVMTKGPIHNATFYATPAAMKNLPKGLAQVTKTKGHVYFSDPKNRAINTTQGYIEPTQVAAAPLAPEPQSGLAAFFSDPLGMQAQAAEAPAGLAAFAQPEAKGLMGATGYDPAKNPANARVAAMFANTPKSAPALADTSFASRFATQPPAQVSAERFAPGLQAPAGPVSPEHYAEATAPSSAKARSAFDAIAGAPGVSSQPESLGAQVGAMVGPAPAAQPDQGRMSPDGRVADPFGNYVDKGPLGTVQKTETERAPGAALAYAPEAAPALGAPKEIAAAPQGLAAYAGPTASLSPDMMAPAQFAGMLPDMAPELSQTAYDKLSRTLQPPEDPQVAEIAGPTISDPMGTYPEAPPEPSMFDPVSKALTGLLTGGPVGGLLSGMMSGGLGSLGPAGQAAAGTHNAGYGLGGMQSGMYGARGTTGYSLSNPGAYSVSRGPNQGHDLTNQFGARTTYGPSGDIRANKDTNWGGVLGGLFGKDKDKSKGAGRGLGGINGSGYSGNGLY